MSRIIYIIVLAVPLTLAAQPNPDQVLLDALDLIIRESELVTDSIPGEADVYPVVKGNITDAYREPMVDAWRKSFTRTGRSVYLISQTGTYQAALRVDIYRMLLHSEDRPGIFAGNSISGTLEFTGEILIADTTGKVLGTEPVEISEDFDVADDAGIWVTEQTRMRYPVVYPNRRDHPEIRTILLAITSGVIIYLFYSMRG
ncbi:MAG: hypothetical protein K9N46_12985 [Candidatus Marinimicrobia bacterium]|nr:hypothetical protein [Candidatus Neomarinimicrobiota bacterium]MCF7829697.1 hypothetical protein [Candidatus Neomarinimicrobiota bacterium]MCF7881647.1 hypothetical protein [Candidatus Neomarinimicrobiota bacterium]